MKRFLGYVILLCSLTASAFGQKQTIDIQVTGVSPEIERNIRGHLISHYENFSRSDLIEDSGIFLKQISPITLKAIQPFGYFSPKIRYHTSKKHGVATIKMHIQLGQITRIHQVNILIEGEGSNEPEFNQLEQHTKLKAGEPLLIQHYNALINSLFNRSAQLGYFNATITKKLITIHPNRHQARVVIHFNTGRRSHFGQTHFNQSPLKTSFLQQYLRYKPNDPYELAKIQSLQQALSKTGYFQKVSVTPLNPTPGSLEVPINIQLQMARSRIYRAGIGYGTDTGPRFTVGAAYKRLNSHGHQLNLALRTSQFSNGALAEYKIPAQHPDTSFYTIAAGYDQENIATGNSQSQKIEGGYTTLLWGWRQKLKLSLLQERYNLTDTPTINSNMLVPSIEWARRRANNNIRPSQGYRVMVRLSGASRAIASRSSFAQAYMDSRLLLSAFNNNSRLFFRGQLGYTLIDDITQLPLSLQLLAGGSQSIRGYDFNSIGPGKIKIVGSIEIQQRFYKDFFAIGFIDRGTVENKLNGHYYEGIGPGIMWLSPIGGIEVSIAKRTSEPGRRWQLQFSMGTAL